MAAMLRNQLKGVALGCCFSLALITFVYLMCEEPHWPNHPCPETFYLQPTYSGIGAQPRQVNCSAIIASRPQEITYAKSFGKCSSLGYTDEEFKDLTQSCDNFKKQHGYYDYLVLEEEKSFPLAFSLLTFENAAQTERLLRAIYRPQNYYCIHVDLNAKKKFQEAMQSIAQCFDNIFIASHPVEVSWSEFSVLEAEIHCMKDLVKRKGWKYFINLTGREFPIRTNWELVQVLRAYNGANDIDGTLHRRPIIWTKYKWRTQAWMTWQENEPPPKGFLVGKGSTHVAATRRFVEYVVYNATAHALFDWMRDIRSPDEHFFPTMNHNPHMGVPGSYKGDPDLKRFLTRFKLWQSPEEHCDGTWWRFICNFGIGDVSRVVEAKELFANKFRLEFDAIAFECMEHWYMNRVKSNKHNDFDVGFYRNQPWVSNHID